MSDPLITRFAEACGATAPLRLRVDLVGGGVLAEGAVNQPFTLVGRDDSCDVTLSDPDINPRHVWLQVLAGRVYAIDLGSRTGVQWPDGVHGSGWLDPGNGAKLGPFSLRLGAPVSPHPGAFPLSYNPLAADVGSRARPPMVLEFRNGKRAKDRWAVNRLLTLVGRAPECKIHLTAEDISLYHCGLVSTPAGVWVVDLSGRGVVVNGERMRVAPLPHGAELWVGRFLIGCQSPPTVSPSAVRADSGPLNPFSFVNDGAQTPPPLEPKPEDEVEFGTVSDDLSSSHIMADAFRGPGLGETPSSSIIVSSGAASAASADAAAALAALLGGTSAPGLVPLLRQMADLHDRTAHEFVRCLEQLPTLFEQVKREYWPVIRDELNRIEDLTVEITGLQSEVLRRTIERAAAGRETAGDPAGPPDGPRAELRRPSDGPALVPGALPHLASGRLNELQQERAARWATVIALLASG